MFEVKQQHQFVAKKGRLIARYGTEGEIIIIIKV
jgi:hypothetical protein